MALGRKTGGRELGTPNKRTVERQHVDLARQEHILASGVSPLEVMIADMRFHHDAALAELSRGDDADLAKVTAELNAARAAAKDAAPYIHPKLASVEYRDIAGQMVEPTDARAKLARLFDGLAAETARKAERSPI